MYMTKTELFEQKQAEMTDKELHALVSEELSKLCKTGGRSITMCVPPMVTDTDMLIGELLNRFKRITDEDTRTREEIEFEEWKQGTMKTVIIKESKMFGVKDFETLGEEACIKQTCLNLINGMSAGELKELFSVNITAGWWSKNQKDAYIKIDVKI